MNTQIKKNGDEIIVTLDGRLDFETAIPLRESLSRLIRPGTGASRTDSTPRKIIFNLEKLEFVGSSGISSFVQTLRDFNTLAPVKPVYCHVKSEFQRVIRAFDESEAFQFFDNEERARKSYDQ
jgi:anti-anti-sigma factor